MHRVLSRAGRNWVKDAWQAVSDVTQQQALLSPLATAVGTGIAQGGGSPDPDADQLTDARFAVVRTGYATRAVLAGPTEQPSADLIWFGLSGPVDAERVANDSTAVSGLIDATLARATVEWQSAMTLPEEVWVAYLVTATRELQRTLVGGSVSRRALKRPAVDELLRCGWLLCCLDEALEQAPAERDQRAD